MSAGSPSTSSTASEGVNSEVWLPSPYLDLCNEYKYFNKINYHKGFTSLHVWVSSHAIFSATVEIYIYPQCIHQAQTNFRRVRRQGWKWLPSNQGGKAVFVRHTEIRWLAVWEPLAFFLQLLTLCQGTIMFQQGLQLLIMFIVLFSPTTSG